MSPPESRSLFGESPDELGPGSPRGTGSGGPGGVGGVPDDTPLAERMRPRTLEEFVGQHHLVGAGRLVRRLIEGDGNLPSMILWGGPGAGKTTLARLFASRANASFVLLSAVLSGVKELRDAIAVARTERRRGRRTVLFVDEIHRFNKSQQDALLPAVEDGTVTLIGATTENPSFEVNAALLSRCRVLTLNPLSETEIGTILRRAVADPERGLAALHPKISDDSLGRLSRVASGDARVALTALESSVLAVEPNAAGEREVSWATIEESLGRARFGYDKGGEDHYNLISALIKSLRNSDENAGVYWLARLITGGADPVFIARRLCILASEDIGLADPQAIVQAAAAAQVVQLIGLPEGLYPLAQATIYLARAPKSATIKNAYFAAAEDAAQTAREAVPLHLRNAVTPLLKSVGYGEGYRYAHTDPAAAREMVCLPPALAGRVYVADSGRPAGDAES